MPRTCTGIDVGLRTVKALRGSYKGNTFHATGFHVASHRHDKVADAWETLAEGFKPGNARVGLTGRDVNIRYLRVPRVPDWQLRKLMHFEVAEIGGQSGAEVASDFNLLPELPEIEGEDVVLLAMARESLLEEHMEGLSAVGGRLESFAPCALGLYNAWLRYGVVQDDTVMVANIGHDNVDVVITRGPDLVFARNLTGGSRLFDEAIAQRFNVGAKQAEKLKIEMASLAPGKNHPTPNHERASRAIMGAAGQLLSLLQSAVLFCKSQVKVSSLKLDRVLLCGGGAALDGLPEYLSAGMSVPVELFDPFRVVDTSGLSPEEAELLEEHQLEAVVALGLATMGSDSEAYSVEVLPASVAKKREFVGGTLWLIAAAVLAVAYLGFYTVHMKGQVEESAVESRRAAAQLAAKRKTHARTEELVAENERFRELALEVQSIVGSGEQLARTLAFLDDALPGDFWITRLSSDRGYDPELGLDQGRNRPIVSIKGRTRPGVESPAVQWQGFLTRLAEEMPEARFQPSLSSVGDAFTLDLSLLAPPAPGAAEEGASEEEEG